eukprot:1923043-Rhodomonas_salina.2
MGAVAAVPMTANGMRNARFVGKTCQIRCGERFLLLAQISASTGTAECYMCLEEMVRLESGNGNKETYTNDLHAYNVTAKTWVDLSDYSGTAPCGRNGHELASWDGMLYVFGGWGSLLPPSPPCSRA